MDGVQCSQNGIWNPEQGIIATAYVSQSDASTLSLALQGNYMGDVSPVLCFLPAFQSDVAKDRASESSANFNKIYPTLVLIAYVLLSIGDGESWRRKLTLLMADFPTIEGISPEKDMGFPAE